MWYFGVMIDLEAHRVSSELSLIEGVHIGARALLYTYLILFGYIARVSHWEEGIILLFCQLSRRIEEGGGGGGVSTLWAVLRE